MLNYKKYTVALLGSHEDHTHSEIDLENARYIGRAVASIGGVLATPAVAGVPLWASLGALEEGGHTIGFSPAGSSFEHTEQFRLPLDYLSSVVYTGFGYIGRDVVMVRSVDALVVVSGPNLSSLDAVLMRELQKPILVLCREGGESFAESSLGGISRMVEFFDNPESLTQRLVQISHTKNSTQ